MSYQHICCQHFRCDQGQDENACEYGLETAECLTFFDNNREDSNEMCKKPESSSTNPPPAVPSTTPPPGL